MSDTDFARLLARAVRGETLNAHDTQTAFAAIMDGAVSEVEIAALLTAFATRKPALPEIVGAARALRQAMLTVEAPPDAIDLCGTGGDAHGTLNISTACAFVVAGAGIPVAKHGNRAMSSKSGGADVLEALGARLEISPSRARTCLLEHKVCFLFAQQYHPAMKYAAPVRRALGFRTIFNLLGPLANPAGVRRQLVGVSDPELLETIAEALRELGAESAWVVHGSDGLDELTTTGPTNVAVLERNTVTRRMIVPAEAGLPLASLKDLTGGSAADNAAAITRLFAGEKSAFRDAVLLNASAALMIAGRARELKEGMALASASLDEGAARRALQGYIAFSRESAT